MWDINDGLFILEMYCYFFVEIVVKYLFVINLIDDIIIGNVYVSEEELKLLGYLDCY